MDVSEKILEWYTNLTFKALPPEAAEAPRSLDPNRVSEALNCLEAAETQPNLPAVCGMLIAQVAMV